MNDHIPGILVTSWDWETHTHKQPPRARTARGQQATTTFLARAVMVVVVASNKQPPKRTTDAQTHSLLR